MRTASQFPVSSAPAWNCQEPDFVAVGLLQAVRQPLGGGEAAREPDVGPEEGGVESDEKEKEGPFHGARFCTKLPLRPLFLL